MIRLLAIALIAGCSLSPQATDTPRIVPKAACGTPCTTTSQCDSIGTCRYCGVRGQCGAGLPADPLQLDAGTDAAPTGTTP